MVRALRVIRNGMIATAIVLAAVAYGTRVRAQPYNNCQDVTITGDYADLTYCGPYEYEGDDYALNDMAATAYDYLETYGYDCCGTAGVVFYWWGRDTPFDQPAYYSSGFAISW
jgi:hypothetical protein